MGRSGMTDSTLERLSDASNVSADLAAAGAHADELNAFYEAVGCGIVVRDVTGGIVHVNGAAEAIMGLTAEEMLGRSSEELWEVVREDGAPIGSRERPSVEALRTGRPVRK